MPYHADLSSGDHVVRFIHDDADLAAAVVPQMAREVRGGKPVVVIATRAHRAHFAAALHADGCDVDAAEASELLIWRDAGDLAAQITAHPYAGGADGAVGTVFATEIEPLVRRTAVGREVVHVYGELVSVLWSAGHVLAAMELEQRWNRLISDVAMSLLCVYSVEVMAGVGSLPGYPDIGYLDICAAHSRVAGTAPFDTGADVTCRFPGTPTAPRHARRLVADTLRVWDRSAAIDIAALVVSELATNAVLHGGPEFTVSLTRGVEAIRIAVGDTVVEPPRLRMSAPDDPHGRGLVLVEQFSARWGSDVVPGGKLVWAELGQPAVSRLP